MPEEIAISLNRAARDVVAERQRQLSAEGYSLYRDDLYVKGELAESGATYASLAGKPTSRSTGWPWGWDTFKPSSDRRRDMVKAAALLLEKGTLGLYAVHFRRFRKQFEGKAID
jgi:hypothetical protein